MTRKMFGWIAVATCAMLLGFLGPDERASGQDCGAYSFGGCAAGRGVIHISPYYGGQTTYGCSAGAYGGGCSGMSYSSQPMLPPIASPYFMAPTWGRYRYSMDYRTPYGRVRERRRWTCGPNGCYLE